jgi:hypothetical protein
MGEYADPTTLDTKALIRDLARASTAVCGSPLEEAAPVNALLHEAAQRLDRQHRMLNTPEVKRFALGVELEAAHQRATWRAAHDSGKTPFDWFWLIGYLAQKAAAAAVAGDVDKAMHHTISTAEALANWHLALSATDNNMRPGIDPADHGVPA